MNLTLVKTVILCLSVTLTVPLVVAEVFSSASDMKAIFGLERQLAETLNSYASTLQAKLDRINSYMEDVQSVMAERSALDTDEEFSDKVVGNPIHAYKAVKRYVVDWKKIERDLSKDDWKEYEFKMKKLRLGSVVPMEDDLHGSAQALLRLQDTYQLHVSDLTKGDIGFKNQRHPTKAKLSAQDCLFMGKHSYNGGILGNSLEWFEEAYKQAGREGNATVGQDQILKFLDYASDLHDSLLRSGDIRSDLFPKPVSELSPHQQRAMIYEKKSEEFYKKLADAKTFEVQDNDNPRYEALCRGEELRPLDFVAKLKCTLDTTKDPYYLLQPIKKEVLHMNPHLIMYHDVIYKEEMAEIKKIAAPLLVRSQVEGTITSTVSKVRTSKTGWLGDSLSPYIKKIGNRIQWITGLKTDVWKDEAELLQVANYINGGHYEAHHDYIVKSSSKPDHMVYSELPNVFGQFIGDRIATWLYYINDVPIGGNTVFPRVGAFTRPIPGSAVFWYNLLPSGDPDPLTLHGACPILVGTKWISNKWIREGPQLFNFPCGVNRDDKFPL